MKFALKPKNRKNSIVLKKSDVDIENKVSVLHKKRRLSLRIFDVIITILGMLSATMCFVTAFDIEVSGYKIVATILITTLISLGIFRVKKGRNIVIITILILYVLGFVNLAFTCDEQFMVLTNTVTKLINKVYYTSFFEFDIPSSVKNGTDYTITFLYIISFLTFIYNNFMNLHYNVAVCFVITLPLAFLGFIFTIMPNEIWFLMYLAFIFVLLLKISIKTQIFKKEKKLFIRRGNEYVLKEDSYYTKDVIIAECILVFCVLIIGCITMTVIPKKSYERIEFFENLRVTVDEEMKHMQNVVFGSKDATGGINGGKLGNVDTIKFSENVDIIAELPKTGSNIYIKAYVGSEYTGRSFDALSNEVYDEYRDEFEYLKSNGFNSHTMSANILSNLDELNILQVDGEDAVNTCMASIKIDNANKKCSYIPYNSNYTNNSNKEDGYMQSIGSKYQIPMYWFDDDARYNVYSEYGIYERYASDYMLFSDENIREYTSDELKRCFENEKVYRDMVYDIYTRLPNSMEVDVVSSFKIKVNTNDDVFSLINNLQQYYRDNFKYTLSPGAVPKEKDVVEYFLNETKQGYCTYFAAASVVLLRAANIPARYVEGYVVKPTDYIGNVIRKDSDIELYKVEIKDSSAHAWVEVYIDGYGWIVADFTPGYQNNFRASGVIHKDNEEKETETITKETVDDKEEETSKEETPTNVTEEETKEVIKETNNNNEDTKDVDVSILKRICISVITCVLAVLIIYIYHIIAILIKRRRLKKANDVKKVRIIYARIEKMLKVAKITRNPFESYIDFAMRIESMQVIFKEGEFVSCINIMESVIYGNDKLTKKDYKYMLDTLKLCEDNAKNHISYIKLIFYKYLANYFGL